MARAKNLRSDIAQAHPSRHCATQIPGANETGTSYAIHMIYRSQLLLRLLVVFALTSLAHAQGDPDMEAKFIAMVKNSTLKGTWAPIAGGQLGSEKKDEAYRIVRAEKKEDGKWAIVSLFEVNGQQIEFPIQASVKFAGDTAILILDNVRAGPGKANWSARVMFHDDVYTGRWWETAKREHGGTISGTVSRPRN